MTQKQDLEQMKKNLEEQKASWQKDNTTPTRAEQKDNYNRWLNTEGKNYLLPVAIVEFLCFLYLLIIGDMEIYRWRRIFIGIWTGALIYMMFYSAVYGGKLEGACIGMMLAMSGCFIAIFFGYVDTSYLPMMSVIFRLSTLIGTVLAAYPVWYFIKYRNKLPNTEVKNPYLQ